MTGAKPRRAAEYLDMWTIYLSPRDMPGKVVGRRWVCSDPPTSTTDFIACDIGGDASEAIQTVRDLIQARDRDICVMLPRQAADEPHIIETWV